MKNFDVDCLVVGCGLTGAVIARHLAEQGKKVVILERRDHIGGNMYDYVDENAICVHKYGPHVFHTYKEHLKNYMLRFGEWVPFFITCRVEMLGKVTPSPFNFQTIDDYYSPRRAAELKTLLEQTYGDEKSATIVELLCSDNPIIKEYADFLFAKDYSLYTAKQWGISPAEIDISVLNRVPVLFSYKDGYFDDTWQMVPKDGYTAWFSRLLNHPNIELHLNVDALERMRVSGTEILLDNEVFDGLVVYTGAIDELLDRKYGALPYRSLRFEWHTRNVERQLPAPLVAYPEAEGYTRITDYSRFPQKRQGDKVSMAYEYPLPYNSVNTNVEPYYPLLTNESIERHEKYLNELKRIPNLVCCGRLADFKYYNMDQALERALNCAKMLQ